MHAMQDQEEQNQTENFLRRNLINTPALAIHHLMVNYDKTVVLWDVSLSVPSGLLVGII